MAEALDTYSDLDMSDSDTEGDVKNLNKEFNLAADHVKKLVGKLETDKLLEIYSLFKQATEGACNIPKPMFYEMQARKKWDAWNSLADLPSDTAKEKYIKVIHELDPGWNDATQKSEKNRHKQTSHWAAVSSLYSSDDCIQEADKTIFDFCKEGNICKVQSLAEFHPDQLNSIDKEGLGLIHWAADRGFCDMLRLLSTLHCDLLLKDDMGQTALHYAASCGHVECVEFLLKCGVDKSLKDDEGLAPIDVANDDTIKQLLL